MATSISPDATAAMMPDAWIGIAIVAVDGKTAQIANQAAARERVEPAGDCRYRSVECRFALDVAQSSSRDAIGSRARSRHEHIG